MLEVLNIVKFVFSYMFAHILLKEVSADNWMHLCEHETW